MEECIRLLEDIKSILQDTQELNREVISRCDSRDLHRVKVEKELLINKLNLLNGTINEAEKVQD